MTVQEAIESATKALRASGLPSPRIESEFLLSALLKIHRTHLVLQRDAPLSGEEIQAFKRWVTERQGRKPLAYVSGEHPFMDLTLTVTPAVLVPRPETELLVEQAFKILDLFPNPSTVVDVGTGSGNIAIFLAHHAKVSHVIGIDISEDALEVAKANAERCRVSEKCVWLLGNVLACPHPRPLPPAVGEGIQMIVANLPYVRTDEIGSLEAELHWEPRIALDGGADGLRLIARCIDQASDVLVTGGHMLLEIGRDQSAAVTDLFGAAGGWTDIQVFKDLAGWPRVVHAQRSGPS